MPLLDRLRSELDRAGRQAQRALDEGRLRLDLYRARQAVDRFAQRFGYAVYRARKADTELPAEENTAHMNNLTAAEAEVTRLETLIAEAAQQRKDASLSDRGKPGDGGPSGGSSGGTPGGSDGGTPGGAMWRLASLVSRREHFDLTTTSRTFQNRFTSLGSSEIYDFTAEERRGTQHWRIYNVTASIVRDPEPL